MNQYEFQILCKIEIIFICLIAIVLPDHVYTFQSSEINPKTKNQKGIKLIKKKKPKLQDYRIKLNTSATFNDAKKIDAYVFMIGNDNYKKRSGFSKLKQCYNDVRLLKQIFIRCCKIDDSRIFSNKDLTLNEFKERFQEFVRTLNEDSMVIITYSGHGDDDGSLVFVNGLKLHPNELKDLINSYKNDTVLMLDACYSGNNEGPKQMFDQKKKQQFKNNAIRIYASLAHLSAKEITYKNPFFKVVLPFYRQVLGIAKIEGNGYFTAMIGFFFAEYQFQKDENISFQNLISFVSNKGKQYVEYIAYQYVRKSGTKQREAILRLNQQPKILPLTESVQLIDQNHNFIFLQSPLLYHKKGFMVGFEGNFALVSVFDYSSYEAVESRVDKVKFLFGGTFFGEYSFTNYLGVSLGFGLKYYTLEAEDEFQDGSVVKTSYNAFILTVPLTVRLRPLPLFGVKYSSLTPFIGLGVDVQLPIWSKRKLNPGLETKRCFGIGLGVLAELGLGYYLSENLLLQGVFKFNIGVLDIDLAADDVLRPFFFEFAISVMYKLF